MRKKALIFIIIMLVLLLITACFPIAGEITLINETTDSASVEMWVSDAGDYITIISESSYEYNEDNGKVLLATNGYGESANRVYSSDLTTDWDIKIGDQHMAQAPLSQHEDYTFILGKSYTITISGSFPNYSMDFDEDEYEDEDDY